MLFPLSLIERVKFGRNNLDIAVSSMVSPILSKECLLERIATNAYHWGKILYVPKLQLSSLLFGLEVKKIFIKNLVRLDMVSNFPELWIAEPNLKEDDFMEIVSMYITDYVAVLSSYGHNPFYCLDALINHMEKAFGYWIKELAILAVHAENTDDEVIQEDIKVDEIKDNVDSEEDEIKDNVDSEEDDSDDE